MNDYRYAFNGMEYDDEIQAGKNSYTTEFRQYDPRLGRWKSLDPLMFMFPSLSPYVGFDNNPVYYNDPYGLASEVTNGDGGNLKGSEGGHIFDNGTESTHTVEVKGLSDFQVKMNRFKLKYGLGKYNDSKYDETRQEKFGRNISERRQANRDYKSGSITERQYLDAYDRYDWARTDGLGNYEDKSGQWEDEYWHNIIERNNSIPEIIPDAISFTVEGTASAAAGASTEIEFTFILKGPDARVKPYITLNQKFGIETSLNIGGGASLSASYKNDGDIRARHLGTPYKDKGLLKLKYFGRETTGSFLVLQGGYEYTLLPKDEDVIHTGSFGLTGNLGSKAIGSAGYNSVIKIPLNF